MSRDKSRYGRCSVKKLIVKILQYNRETSALKSLLNKVACCKACNFILKRLQHKCFPVNIEKFLRTRILKNICVRLLLGSATL